MAGTGWQLHPMGRQVARLEPVCPGGQRASPWGFRWTEEPQSRGGQSEDVVVVGELGLFPQPG